ncbi:MAG: hypothetical protein ACRCYC_16735 [Paraclostridium sp.]|uniref:hypothetical protein n=1 Tax=Paraclostridium sp. TaxID=2023273 RepID=UPI003F3ED4FC
MKKNYKNILKLILIPIFILGVTIPNSNFKPVLSVNRVDSSDKIYEKYLIENKKTEGISIINNNKDKNKLMKNEEAYIIFKNRPGKYYNNVTIKNKNSDIIIKYEEANIDDSYNNDIYNSRIGPIMLLKIKSNEEINGFKLLNH